MAFEESEYKDVKGRARTCFLANNANPSNLVIFISVQSASVCCHTDKLTQKRQTLAQVRTPFDSSYRYLKKLRK